MSDNPFGSNIGDASTDKAFAHVPAVGTTVRDAPAPRVAGKKPDTRPRVRIRLEENDNIGPTGQFFGYQGVGYMLKPGLEADVPAALIDILNNAIMEVPQVDPNTLQITGFRKKLRFPYTVVALLPAQTQAAA